MKITFFAAALCVAAFPAMAAPLAPDQPMSFGRAEVVCTGVGSAQDDPQWSSYPIRMVFSNAAGQFVSGTTIALYTSAGGHVGSFQCDTPWALLKLPAGSYRANVKLDESGTVRSARFSAGAIRNINYNNSNQKRVEIQFPLPANQ